MVKADSKLFQYRSDFPASIKELVVFADLAPRFQLLAEEVLQRQIKLVIYNLKQVTLPPELTQAHFGFLQVVYISVIIFAGNDVILGYRWG